MSDVLFLDIETIETTNTDIIQDIADSIKPPGNIKKPESITKWEEEKKPQAVADAIRKTSFDGFAGSICSISWAVNDDEIKSVFCYPEEDDNILINNFFGQLIEDNGVNFNPLLVAHNAQFDLGFMYKRCVVNGIKPTIDFPAFPKPWDKSVYCTLYHSVGLEKVGGSLDRVCKILGIGKKTEGIHGSMINQYYLDGRIDEIVEYNKQDVYLLRELYKRLNFINKVEEK